MNREQRRSMDKQGGELKYLQSPCTITEAVQIARGVAEDVVSDYANHSRHLQVALSLQVEILKSIVIKAGLITEDEFKEEYIKQAEEFNKMQEEAFKESEGEHEDTPDNVTKMDQHVNDIEIVKE